jgi:hypothetical protein
MIMQTGSFVKLVAAAAACCLLGSKLPAADSASNAVPAAAVDDFGVKLIDYRHRIEACLAQLENKAGGTNMFPNAGMSASLTIDSYYRFEAGLNEVEKSRAKGDTDLIDGLCSLCLAYGAYTLAKANIDSERPYVTPLVEAYDLYVKAYECTSFLKRDMRLAERLRRIDTGLMKIIRGCEKYNEWFVKDTLMNPEGKPWKDNPAVMASRIRKELAFKTETTDKFARAVALFEKSLEEINASTAKGDGVQAFKKMIEGARHLSVLKDLDRLYFLEQFKRFNIAGNRAMPLVNKAYSNEDAKAFRDVYTPLVELYNAMQPAKKK